MRRMVRVILRPRLLVLLAAIVCALPTGARAHEIPSTVTIFSYIKPEGARLRFLVRVPLESMRDFIFPTRGIGYLVFGEELDRMLIEAAQLWILDYVTIYENDEALTGAQVVAARISLPSDRSFASYDEAMAHILGPPLPDTTELVWQQALLDVLIEYPIASDRSDFSLDSRLAHLGISTTTVLRFLPAGGSERIYQYTGVLGRVHLDPSWLHAALQFVELGFKHILEGLDHLLFLFLLVVPFRNVRPLIAIITAFTVAHSITLIASSLGFGPSSLWFPTLIEVLIALSILFMAFENIVGVSVQRRWLITFIFGLVHGFGFSWQLRESLQFAGSHLTTSLLTFNIGVELGQLLVVALTVPVLALLFRYVVAERIGTILLSALVAHVAWHWMTERGSEFLQYDIQLPAVDALFLASLMRWLMLILLSGTAAWLLHGLIGRLLHQPAPEGERAQG